MEEAAVNKTAALFDVNAHISWVARILSERACEVQVDFCSVNLL